jgi:hypothetical protein
VDRGVSAPSGTVLGPESLLVLPFFGGPDDRLALKMLVKICAGHESVRGIVIRVSKYDSLDEEEIEKKNPADIFVSNVSSFFCFLIIII